MSFDFKEIAQANTGSGDQDLFELFCRDFLSKLGFEILENPSRGSDGGLGKDLIVIERKNGYTGIDEVQWLVSCKHFAHSGKSVGTEDEKEITDRVIATGSDGFMGFYSTLPSSGLNAKFQGIKENSNISVFYFDRAKIEEELTEKDYLVKLALRYFPKSTSKWLEAIKLKIDVFDIGKDEVVRGTGTFDFYKGGPGGPGWDIDFHWQIVSIKRDEKYITPYRDTLIARISGIEYNAIDRLFLEKQDFSGTKINGSGGEKNEIYPGAIFAFKRKDGIYAKIIIKEVGYDLHFKYETFV